MIFNNARNLREIVSSEIRVIYNRLISFNGTYFFRNVISLLLLLIIASADAQQTFNISYGSDPLLVNGRYYSFFPPPNTDGNQYLADSQFEKGTLTIRGETFSDLMLNYDIYNQHLLLAFRNISGADNLIIISDAWLEKFTFREKDFEMISFQDTVKRILQVIGSGPDRIGYIWKKNLEPDSFHGARYYSFSLPKKEMLYLSGDQMLRFRNNRTFYSALDDGKRKVVREYLERHRINVRKAADRTMADVMDFCNSQGTK